MAQKINSNYLRLNKRLNWDIIFSSHNFNDFFNLTINTSKLIETNTNLLNNLNLTENNCIIFKNSKIYKINFEILNQKFFFNFVKFLTVQKQAIKNFYNYKIDYLSIIQSILKIFYVNQIQFINTISSIERQNKFQISNNNKRPFLFMSAKIITEFLKIQISEIKPFKLKKNNFVANLQIKLINFINFFLTEFKYDIVGVKIICIGKWKKTKTGRKQKFYLKYGKIQKSDVRNKIIFHNINETTKYGICSLKIWIAHK